MADIELKRINEPASASPKMLVLDSEHKYREKIRAIAEHAAKSDNLRAILLAGPSGSGKTTTANLLKDLIISLGEEATVLSLDDFYRDAADPEYPRTVDGALDFECPEALNLPELETVLKNITDGKPFICPRYDFKISARSSSEMHPAMPDGCVIIEGLHALNPKISKSLPKDRILKLFVSVSTNITDGGGRIISGRKLRFVRRLVRDSIYRAADAERTLSMWTHVLDGEDKYLYPYKESADVSFDTFHAFEPGVMREPALRLLNEYREDNPYANIVREALLKVVPISEELVPADSLLREFISGGIYHSIYE